MSVLSDPNLMAAVRKADNLGVLPEFLDGLAKRCKRENRARRKVRDAAEALEKLNRMRRARGMPEV